MATILRNGLGELLNARVNARLGIWRIIWGSLKGTIQGLDYEHHLKVFMWGIPCYSHVAVSINRGFYLWESS